MALKLSLPPGESLHIAGGMQFEFNRRTEVFITRGDSTQGASISFDGRDFVFDRRGDLPFIRGRDYVHPEEDKGLTTEFIFALQRHYLEDGSEEHIQDAASKLVESDPAAKPLVVQVIRELYKDNIFGALSLAARNLTY